MIVKMRYLLLVYFAVAAVTEISAQTEKYTPIENPVTSRIYDQAEWDKFHQHVMTAPEQKPAPSPAGSTRVAREATGQDSVNQVVEDKLDKKICEPGVSYQEDCNACTCSSDGKSRVCTQMLCPSPVTLDSTYLLHNQSTNAVEPEADKKICEPGVFYKEDCNSCTCSADGKSRFCTQMLCSSTFILNSTYLLHNQTTDAVVPEADKIICQPGVTYEEDSNVCTCSSDGKSRICTQMLWPLTDTTTVTASPLRRRRQVNHNKPCTPGKTFMQYCNTCTCAADGISVSCTRRGCDPNVYNEDGSLKNVEQVIQSTPLSRERRDINYRRACTPHQRYRIYCYSCVCGPDAFSLMCVPSPSCDPNLYNEDGSLKNVEQGTQSTPLLSERRQVSQIKPCTPGETFNATCNTCTCGDDGYSVRCTAQACDSILYKADGILKTAEELTDKSLLETRLSHSRACKPGKVYTVYCSTCSCGPDGFSLLCSRPPSCDFNLYNEDGSLKNVEQVTQSTPLLRKRRQVSQIKPCTPGETFNATCNACTCGDDGYSVRCTAQACDSILYKADGILKTAEELPDKSLLETRLSHSRACKPGKVYTVYCSTCSCGPDGFSLLCSRPPSCDFNLYNEDGSLKNVDQVTQSTPLLRERRQVSQIKPCTPGETFNATCNACTCGDDGYSVRCTAQACDSILYKADGILKTAEELPDKSLLETRLSHSRACKPGKVYTVYCSTCSCGPDGFSLLCSRPPSCDFNLYNEDGSLKNVDQVTQSTPLLRERRQVSQIKPCTPGETFNATCNTCTCGDDGYSVRCTAQACDSILYKADGILKTAEELSDKSLLETRLSHSRACKPGKVYTVYCSTCSCGPDGFSLLCSRPPSCDFNLYNEDGSLKNVEQVTQSTPLLRKRRQVSQIKPCTPGETFNATCNACTCGDDGYSVRCTAQACDSILYKADGILKTAEELPDKSLLETRLSHSRACKPGKVYTVYCGTCSCGPDGFSLLCSKPPDCNPNLYNEDGSFTKVDQVIQSTPLPTETRQVSRIRACKPGESFQAVCNTCYCGDDGYSVSCSARACNSVMYNEDGTLKTAEQLPDASLLETRLSHSRACKPGRIYKVYCTTCSCGPDGFSLLCSTPPSCDPNLYNEDGSLKNVEQVTQSTPLLRKRRQVSQIKPCTPGETFNVTCNTCTCGSNGYSVRCTARACDSILYKADGILKTAEELPDKSLLETRLSHSRACKPGKVYTVYCGTCSCGPDGFSLLCSKPPDCNPNLYNEDGSFTKVDQVIQSTPLPTETRQVSRIRACKPGESFQAVCNTCYCGDDGYSVSCSARACNSVMYNEDGTLKTAEQLPDASLLETRLRDDDRACKPGRIYKVYCTTCSCGPDGFSLLCSTPPSCDPNLYNEDGSLKNVEQVTQSTPLPRERRQVSHNRACTPGETFKAYCNTCTCGPDGYSVACTRQACDPNVYNPDGTLKNDEQVPKNSVLRTQVSHNRACTPGQAFNIYCNRCTCGPDGFSVACTRKGCDPNVYNEDGSLKNVEQGTQSTPLLRERRQVSHNRACTPGETFKAYCNTCTCGPDGYSVACTRQACDPNVYNADGTLKNDEQVPQNSLLRTQVSHNRACTPGQAFNIYCNRCTCGPDGFSVACTRKGCDPNVYNEDGSLKNVEQVTQSTPLLRERRQVSHNRACTPGETFKAYCNTCTCGPDGYSVACTRQACDPNVYNPDGTLKNDEQVPKNSLLRTQVSHNRACTPGQAFNIYCNRCTCGPDGFSVACTRKGCDPNVYNEDGSLKNVEQVTQSTPLLRERRQVSHNRACTPGETFKAYCNTCTCGPDGYSVACTRQACDPNVYNPDGTLKNDEQVPKNSLLRTQVSHNRACTPGQAFKIYCNRCTCGSDGFSVACTRKACDPNVYNEDGSLKNSEPIPTNDLLRRRRQAANECKPGTTFKLDCNTCTCSANGIPLCTAMACGAFAPNTDNGLKSA